MSQVDQAGSACCVQALSASEGARMGEPPREPEKAPGV